MANNDIIELLDILYGMVTEAWSVPLGNDKCIIEREKAIEIINEIKNSLPTAIAEAQRLVSARDEFIGNAKREAEALRKNAEEQAHQMIEEQEVVRVARARSSEMVAAAEAKSKELRRVASEYVACPPSAVRMSRSRLSAVASLSSSPRSRSRQPSRRASRASQLNRRRPSPSIRGLRSDSSSPSTVSPTSPRARPIHCLQKYSALSATVNR